MPRSKHTDPKVIRAARRVRSAFAPRSEGDLSLRRLGDSTQRVARAIPVRIREEPPRRGFFHPVSRKELARELRALGAHGLYGLKEVILARVPRELARRVIFGQYEAPGRVLLYEQPLSPWRLAGEIRREVKDIFENAGAVVTSAFGETLVDWPEGALREFMLSEVLRHEIGHHVLQQYKGKRRVAAARKRDHEEFARLYVERERRARRQTR